MSKNLEFGILLDFYSFILTEKQVKFLDLYYNQDYSLSEIADEFGVTRQASMDLIKRGSKKLENIENELKLYEKFDTTITTLQECKRYINEQNGKNHDIIDKIDKAILMWEDKDGV